jgi:hypothetical protein
MLDTVPTIFDKHVEDNYVDFYIERNMPVMVSREGPRAAVADVNGDGNDDIYIGGASGQTGQLYLQTANGFAKTKQPAFELMAQFEDVATIFFDADKDGDQDLLVGSGGNHLQPGIREMQNRLYKNDGKGLFTLDVTALPENSGNTSTIAANDFDNDGDLDVFIGSKCVPQNYGALPTHYLLRNKGNGQFENVTAELFPASKIIGFVSAAIWADINNDKKMELIVVGEFMAPHIFQYTSNGMKEIPSNLTNYYGWWQSVASADLDNDGDLDLVLGNMGYNCYLKSDSTHPIKLWYGDFDNNLQYDKVLTRTENGKDVPVFLKRDLTDQIPSLKKQNLRFEAYATRSIQELFAAPLVEKSKQYQINEVASVVALNQGNGQFTIQRLPKEVQFSSVHAICITDLNNDSKPDLLMGGNQYAMMPQFGRLDASFGHALLNNGAGSFSWIEPKQSGLQVKGAIKDIQQVQGKNKGYILLRNNDTPVFIKSATGKTAPKNTIKQ